MAQVPRPRLRLRRPQRNPSTPLGPARSPLRQITPIYQLKSTRNSKREQSAPRHAPGCGRNSEHVATIELFNTLGGKIEPLAPVGTPALRMYCCGPTVYD